MTGIVLLPLLILLLLFTGRPLLVAFLAVINFAAQYEFAAMTLSAGRRQETWLGSGCGSVLLVLLAIAPSELIPVWLAATMMLFGSWYLFRYRSLDVVARDLAFSLLGILYLPILLVHIILLFDLPFGRQWIFLVLLVVMAADTGAYFVGSMLGRSKLYPAVSPNKSWEGFFGGVAGSLLGALLAKFWFFHGLSGVDVVLVGVLLSVIGQLGDLFESLLKRSCGVKDSGRLIPGHGGLLDRLDSLLFAFPMAYFYAVLLF